MNAVWDTLIHQRPRTTFQTKLLGIVQMVRLSEKYLTHNEDLEDLDLPVRQNAHKMVILWLNRCLMLLTEGDFNNHNDMNLLLGLVRQFPASLGLHMFDVRIRHEDDVRCVLHYFITNKNFSIIPSFVRFCARVGTPFAGLFYISDGVSLMELIIRAGLSEDIVFPCVEQINDSIQIDVGYIRDYSLLSASCCAGYSRVFHHYLEKIGVNSLFVNKTENDVTHKNWEGIFGLEDSDDDDAMEQDETLLELLSVDNFDRYQRVIRAASSVAPERLIFLERIDGGDCLLQKIISEEERLDDIERQRHWETIQFCFKNFFRNRGDRENDEDLFNIICDVGNVPFALDITFHILRQSPTLNPFNNH